MKRAKIIEKRIISLDANVLSTGTNFDLMFGGIEDYPGTLFGVHFTITSTLTDSLSNEAHVHWALYIRRKDQPINAISPVALTGPRALWLNNQGNDVDTLVSGIAYVVRELIPEGLVIISDKEIGQVRTERKLQEGDVLAFAGRSDALLGVTIACDFTFWKRS